MIEGFAFALVFSVALASGWGIFIFAGLSNNSLLLRYIFGLGMISVSIFSNYFNRVNSFNLIFPDEERLLLTQYINIAAVSFIIFLFPLSFIILEYFYSRIKKQKMKLPKNFFEQNELIKVLVIFVLLLNIVTFLAVIEMGGKIDAVRGVKPLSGGWKIQKTFVYSTKEIPSLEESSFK